MSRRSKRGFMASFFGGGGGSSSSSSSRAPPQPPAGGEMMMMPAEQPPPPAELPFARTLPTFEELPEIVRRLTTFDWNQRIVAYTDAATKPGGSGSSSNTYAMPPGALLAADYALTAALQQLCAHYLGGTVVVTIPDYVLNQYKGIKGGRSLVDYLLRVLLGTEGVAHMSPAQRSLLEQPGLAFPPDICARLTDMYPHLMVLIKALLVHLCQHADERHNDASSLQHTVQRVWRDVLGDLDALRIVLVRADELGTIQLGEWPRAWTDFIRETLDRVHACQGKVHAAEQEAMALRARLSERTQALNAIAERYDDPQHQFELLQGEQGRLKSALKQATDVVGVLRSYDGDNITRLLGLGVGVGKTSA